MHTKMYYSLIKRLISYKVCLCCVVFSITVCTVGYICSFGEGQFLIRDNLLSFMYITMMFKV